MIEIFLSDEVINDYIFENDKEIEKVGRVEYYKKGRDKDNHCKAFNALKD